MVWSLAHLLLRTCSCCGMNREILLTRKANKTTQSRAFLIKTVDQVKGSKTELRKEKRCPRADAGTISVDVFLRWNKITRVNFIGTKSPWSTSPSTWHHGLFSKQTLHNNHTKKLWVAQIFRSGLTPPYISGLLNLKKSHNHQKHYKLHELF